jgi:tRNA uridine 5-carbamoylmethylation protein Kti12
MTVFAVTGPPGAGKTTLCREILARYEKGVHLPLDEVRKMVVQGLAESIDWTEETERQFQLAEEAACAMASVYARSGFVVCLDHCRNIPRWNSFLAEHLQGLSVVRVCLLPSLEENLSRNEQRTNKSFDPAVLTGIILGMQDHYRSQPGDGWLILDTTKLTPSQAADIVMNAS